MRIAKLWSVGLVVLVALAGVAAAQGGGGRRGPTSGPANGKGDLQIYFVDVEGGQSTLFVAPGGESLLVDTGSPDPRNPTAPRDASRIAAMCKLAGVTKIDNLLITHYHSDHVGGLPQLTALIPVGRFIDHGVNRETADVQGGASTIAGYNAYQKVIMDSHAEHLTVKPGDVLPIKAMHVEVVSGDGEVIAQPLKTPLAVTGEQNPFCAASPLKDAENTENDRSLGLVITFGKLRIQAPWRPDLEQGARAGVPGGQTGQDGCVHCVASRAGKQRQSGAGGCDCSAACDHGQRPAQRRRSHNL